MSVVGSSRDLEALAKVPRTQGCRDFSSIFVSAQPYMVHDHFFISRSFPTHKHKNIMALDSGIN